MNWKDLFTPGTNLSPEEVRAFMAVHPRDSYQLLDVRQAGEYEKGHLAGALLMPVKEVTTRMAELGRDKPLLVYCHSGLRSKAAAQLLLAQGFSEVYNMSGGIVAWQGEQVSGGELQGLEFFLDRDYPDAFHMAYAMEEGLRRLYLGLVRLVVNEDSKQLLARLASFEEGHKVRLAALFKPADFEADDGAFRAGGSNNDSFRVVEGALAQEQIMTHFAAHLANRADICRLGIMLEAQALDLYTRLVRKSEEGTRKELFAFLAIEEARHLDYLSEELDKLLSA